MELTEKQKRLLTAVLFSYKEDWFTSEQVYQLNELRQAIQDSEKVTIN